MITEQLNHICRQHQALLLEPGPNKLRIAVSSPPADALIQALRFASQLPVEVEIWSPERVEKQRQLSVDSSSLPNDGDAISALDELFRRAIERRASDIHIEPGANQSQIRLRIDGVLQPLPPINTQLTTAISARLKVLAGLDIAERRMPQDGQLRCTVSGVDVSFRLSTLPCLYGETLVLRLQESQNQASTLDNLGIGNEQLKVLRESLHQPQGLILVTGPTGSGKTMTLYAALSELNHPGMNLCSVEDPVEIPMAGLNQVQINNRAGLTFQKVLRALLRQDPDVIMIGEIRDNETATIALNAAQTGHLVLSTLHTNSTAETLTRLNQMETPPWMVAAALKLIVAQRLVRRLCPHCRQRGTNDINLPPSLWPTSLPDWQPVGCEHCYSGYYGRLALFELMPITTPLREAILSKKSAGELTGLAVQMGMQSLWQCGFDAVQSGLTTLEEIWRVVGLPHGNA
ncbi:type II secretion system protein GspE [Salmonella enterica subsp. enterica serovar Choleraesuis]|nr:type II secretion system protein GspE [Salmonella enterica subsp. enterica serovar Choleraesuis]